MNQHITPSQPRNDRYRSHSHSISKPYSSYQYKPTVILTQQPSSLIHHPPSTEPKFESIMYHPNTSLCFQYSTLSNNHAIATIALLQLSPYTFSNHLKKPPYLQN